MIKKAILSFLLIINSHFLFAQNDVSVKKLLDEYMYTIRIKDYTSSPSKELYSEKNSKYLLTLLVDYYADTLAKVRSKAYYLTYKASYRSNIKEIKNNAVFNLVQALKDKDPGVVGNVADLLTNYYNFDFNSASKDSLRSILHVQTNYRDKIIRLIGFLNLTDQIEYLKTFLSKENSGSRKVIWATNIALARLGDDEKIDFCIEYIKNQPLNDDVIYELVPDLIYTRNKKVIDYLVEILLDETKNCHSANPENPQKIECGYRMMEYLAPVIKDFPLKIDSSGDLIADDYEEALKITRNWFKEHDSNYAIVDYTF
jgi:HEAT repeat protein